MTIRAHTPGDRQVVEASGVEGPIAPPHRHRWSETHYVVEGEMDYWVSGATHRVGAGSFFTIPGDTVHALTAVSPSVRWVEITPGDSDPVGFFETVSREANELPPDMEKLGVIAARYGVELLLG
jgi:quercetin dioxygenase-like cupin family protein